MSTGAEQNDIDHNYHDHAGDLEEDLLLSSLFDNSSDQPSSTSNRRGASTCYHSFPIHLHYMLTEIEKDGLSHIVSWQPHGRCFLVHNKKQFVQIVLPCWFRQSKFPSFQRQLNLYGFRRLTTGVDKGGYYHELFLRSKPKLCYRIQRTKVKGTGTRKPSSPSTEPNFYLMQFLPKSNGCVESSTLHTTDSCIHSNFSQSLQNPNIVDILLRPCENRSMMHPCRPNPNKLGADLQPSPIHRYDRIIEDQKNCTVIDLANSLLDNPNGLFRPKRDYDFQLSEGRPTCVENTKSDAQKNYEYILSTLGFPTSTRKNGMTIFQRAHN